MEYYESEDEFTPPPSKRQARSVSEERGKNDPSYRGNRGASPSRSTKSDYFPATKLFEYQWPLGDPTAEYYMLQEQVKEFLDIRGIQRKYPDWRRRTLELDERKYLVGMGVVTETLSNMGLVALNSEEVLEAMATDYPDRYSEFVTVLKEKEFQQTLRNKMIEAWRLAAVSAQQETDESHLTDLRSSAMKMASQFNRHLAQQRAALSRGHINPHTKQEQVPRPQVEIRPAPLLSRYPVALLPGQYSDYCPTYSPSELRGLPLNTVSGVPKYLCIGEQENPPPQPSSGGQGNSESGGQNSSTLTPAIKSAANDLLKALNTSSDKQPSSGGKQAALLSSIQKLLSSYSSGVESSSSKSGDSPDHGSVASSTRRSSLSELLRGEGRSGKGSSNPQLVSAATKKETEVKPTSEDKVSEGDKKKEDNNVMENENKDSSDTKEEKGEPDNVVAEVDKPAKPKRANVRTALCSVCRKGRGSNTKGVAEDLIRCSQCYTYVHPSCYNLPSSILPILKLYPWQCLDCKSCQVCSKPNEEDKMVFCDDCDRGYHSFCVGLDSVPSGNWLCPVCGRCACCGVDQPGPAPESKWKHEYIDGRFVQTLCTQCSGFFRRDYYCPVCYKVYRNDHTDSPMVCCDRCDRWVHTGCDGISTGEYQRLSEDRSSYVCKLCRNK